MVQIQQYLKKTNDFQDSRHLPLLNSLFIERFSEFNPYAKDNTFKTYMKWARRSPAMMGFMNVLTTDILSDATSFEPLDNNSTSGRNRKLQAERFWMENDGNLTLEETLYDTFINGIGYNWLGTINDLQLKEFCDNISERIYDGKEIKEKSESMFHSIKRNKPELIAKKLRYMAASTVSIHTDQYEPTQYIQRVGSNIKRFKPEEIIDFRLMPFDGEIYPYPPMESLLAEIYLLWLISQNYISLFENGGEPDNVFILPKEIAGSKNHSYLIETLKKYKKIQNKHGNLVFTGDLTVQKLNDLEAKMQYKDLGLYLVGMLAMMYGIPAGRIPFLIGKAANNGDSGGLADSGYWRKISVWQAKIEHAYNKKLWIPHFGVTMKFRRGYLQDEVRETQNDVQKTSVVEQRLALGLWTIEAAGKYLDIDEDEIHRGMEQKKQRDEEEMKSSMLLQNQDNNDNVINEPDKKLKAKTKQDTQKNNKQINP